MGAIRPFEPGDGAYGIWSNPIWFSNSQDTPPRATANRDDAHQVDPEPAGFARHHGADTSVLERGSDAPRLSG
jgi:hypothetical protein